MEKTEEQDSYSDLSQLRNLQKQYVHSDNLEKQVLNRITEEKLINNNMKTLKFYWLATAIAGIVAGFFIGRYDFLGTVSISDNAMGKYLILLHEDSTFTSNGQDISMLIKEYSDWGRGLSESGRLDAAEKLTDQYFTLGNLPESGSTITGFFLIRSSSIDEAVAIAKSSPHLRYNGSIEVRPIETNKAK